MKTPTKIQIFPVDKANPVNIAAMDEIEKASYPHANDLFDADDWPVFACIFHFFFIVVDGQVVGTLQLGPNLEWEEEDMPNESLGTLYSAGLAVLPEFRRRGIATFVKKWQIDYARVNGFRRIVTYCRESAVGMVALNQKLGYQLLRKIEDAWYEPEELGLVFEYKLQ